MSINPHLNYRLESNIRKRIPMKSIHLSGNGEIEITQQGREFTIRYPLGTLKLPRRRFVKFRQDFRAVDRSGTRVQRDANVKAFLETFIDTTIVPR